MQGQSKCTRLSRELRMLFDCEPQLCYPAALPCNTEKRRVLRAPNWSMYAVAFFAEDGEKGEGGRDLPLQTGSPLLCVS